MGKYKKKPVVIEAFQMTMHRRNDNSDWPDWMHEAWNTDNDVEGSLVIVNPKADSVTTDFLAITTLEGVMVVGWNDWIIQGVQGELYPCKPDIFEATYEAVDP